MKRGFFKVVIALVLSIMFLSPTHVNASSYVSMNVGYQSLVSGTLQDYAYGGALSGSEGGSPLQGISLHLVDAAYNANIEYRVYTVEGWTNWAKNFEVAQSNQQDVLGVQIRLANIENSNVYYQTYRQGLGWCNWVKNGSTSGQLDAAHPITGLRVQVDELGVQYQSNVGGSVQVIRHNRETQGSGLIYTIKMGLISSNQTQKIEYRAYFKNSGWSNWASNMTSIGSERSGDVITALEARLVNLPGYHVRIQPQVNGEWWDWVYDGELAGTHDTALTAYRVEIVKDKVETLSGETVTAPVQESEQMPEQDPVETDPFVDELGTLGADDLRIVLTWYPDDAYWDDTHEYYEYPTYEQDYDLYVSREYLRGDLAGLYDVAYWGQTAVEYQGNMMELEKDVIPSDDDYTNSEDIPNYWQEVARINNVSDSTDSIYWVYVENASWNNFSGQTKLQIFYGESGVLFDEIVINSESFIDNEQHVSDFYYVNDSGYGDEIDAYNYDVYNGLVDQFSIIAPQDGYNNYEWLGFIIVPSADNMIIPVNRVGTDAWTYALD